MENEERMIVDVRNRTEEDLAVFPSRLCVFLDGRDMTGLAYCALLPVQEGIEADGWVETWPSGADARVTFGQPPRRRAGKVKWTKM